MARVLIVNAPSHEPGKVLNKAGRWIPGEQLGLCYLAAVLRERGHAVEIWDAFMLGLSDEQVAARIVRDAGGLDVVGLSVSDGKVHGCAGTLGRLSSLPERVHLTMGGHTATLCHKEFLQSFSRLDSVIRGEGEVPLLALCEALDGDGDWREVAGVSSRRDDGTIRFNHMPELSGDLDTLPFPARDNLGLCVEKGFSVSVETSRGCKGVCTFCATRMMYQPGLGRTWRPRSVGNVLDEVEMLIREHGVRRIAFEDEDFLGFGSKRGFDRAREFAAEVERRGLDFEFAMLTRVDNVDHELMALLQRAGLRFVFIGAETGSQRTLDFYRKETSVDQNARAVHVLRDLGIDHEVLWIMYDPETRIEDVEANIDFLQHIEGLNANLLNKLRVYHGTPMHALLAKRGRLRGDYLEYEYDFADPLVATFEKEATRGLNAYYQVVNKADTLKWQIGDGHQLNEVISTVMERLHWSAVGWLGRLLDAVKDSRPTDHFQDEAVDSAADSARLLARVVSAWPVATAAEASR